MIGLLLLIFFTAFSLLEAVLPSWVSKLTPVQMQRYGHGLSIPALSFWEFLSAAGWRMDVWLILALEGIFVIGASLALVWLGLAIAFAAAAKFNHGDF